MSHFLKNVEDRNNKPMNLNPTDGFFGRRITISNDLETIHCFLEVYNHIHINGGDSL